MSEKLFVQGRERARRRVALAATMAVGGWLGVLAPAASQVVKAPRYQGGLEAPAPTLNLPPLPPAISAHGTVVENVVVRVNDQIITRSEVERAEMALGQDLAQQKMNSSDAAAAQRDLLRDLIDEQLLLSKAKELGLNADADVIRQLDEIRKKNNMDSLDDLEKAARAQGVNFEDFKAQIRNGILKQEVVRDEVGRRLQLSEAEEKKYYAEHLKEFDQPEQIHLSEILVPLGENATAAEIAQAEAKANDIKTKVMKGEDFAGLAKKYSGGPTAAQGGELGAYKKGGLPQVLEDQTYPLKVGESTQPIRTKQGYVILKVTGHDLAGPAAMKDVEPQIQEAVYMQAMQPALRTYLTKLRTESYVELAPGYVDSGGTPDETKPVYTAYAPPAVKKKKVKAKSRFDGNARYQTVAATKATKASSPDNGGRTFTGADAQPAVDANTGMAVVSGPATSAKTRASSGGFLKKGKKVKIKREKVRFGQAPRQSLGEGGPDETAVAANAPAPGAAMAVNGTSAAEATNSSSAGAASADLADNPLTPTEAPKKKTRFAATADAVKAKKVSTLTAKDKEKALAVATPASADEKADTKEQAAPLGLAGDTGKKKKTKKPKKVKGQTKERLAEKAPEVKPVAPEIAPTANPKLAPTDVPAGTGTAAPATDTAAPADKATPASTGSQTVPNSSVPRSVPNEPDTTLPPVTQPTPGSPQQGQPVPNPPN